MFFDTIASVDYRLTATDLEQVVHGGAAVWRDRLAEFADRFGPGMRVLDCACGSGLCTLGVAAAGFDVTGTDVSTGMLAEARRHAGMAGSDVVFAQSSWCDLPRHFKSQFDLVLCVDNSIVHAVDDEDLVASLRGMRSVLVPGGRCSLAWVAPEMYGTPGEIRILPVSPQFTGDRTQRTRSLQFRLWEIGADNIHQTYVRLREQPTAAAGWSQCIASARVLRLHPDRMRSCARRSGFSEVELRNRVDRVDGTVRGYAAVCCR